MNGLPKKLEKVSLKGGLEDKKDSRSWRLHAVGQVVPQLTPTDVELS